MARRVHGEGTINRRKDGRYEAKLRVGTRAGKPIRKSFYATRQEVAEQLRAYTNRHRNVFHTDFTLAEYAEQWLADSDWRPNTYRLRSGAMKRHILPYIGSRRVADLDVDDIKLLFRELKHNKIGAATRRLAHATLNAAPNVLYRERKILFNLCSLVSAPRYETRESIVLDRHQVAKLIKAAQGQTRVLVVMAATLGMREAELLGLLWNCVDFDRRTVTVVRQLTEDIDGKLVLSELKTKASRRTLKLPDLAHRVLSQWRQSQLPDGNDGAYVFTDGEGNRFARATSCAAISSRCSAAPGCPDVSFHSLRRSSNSFLIEEGSDPVLIARRNGHASTRMVLDRYGHFFEGARRQAAETMDRVFSGVQRHEAVNEIARNDVAMPVAHGRQLVVKALDPRPERRTRDPRRARVRTWWR